RVKRMLQHVHQRYGIVGLRVRKLIEGAGMNPYACPSRHELCRFNARLHRLDLPLRRGPQITDQAAEAAAEIEEAGAFRTELRPYPLPDKRTLLEVIVHREEVF